MSFRHGVTYIKYVMQSILISKEDFWNGICSVRNAADFPLFDILWSYCTISMSFNSAFPCAFSGIQHAVVPSKETM
jgi:hypothetical protein